MYQNSAQTMTYKFSYLVDGCLGRQVIVIEIVIVIVKQDSTCEAKEEAKPSNVAIFDFIGL